MQCDKAPLAVDFRGAVVTRHVPTDDWSLTECVSRLHKKGMTWEDICWLLWVSPFGGFTPVVVRTQF